MNDPAPIFKRPPTGLRRLLLLILLGLLLLTAGSATALLLPVRTVFIDLVAPFYHATDLGSALTELRDDTLLSREQLLADRARLRDENLILQRHALTTASLRAENQSLRGLLGAAELVEEQAMLAELIGQPPDTDTHRLVINRGWRDKVTAGQPVIDAGGIVGQVTVVGERNSEIILISDARHALPVEFLRSGIRAIAAGSGDHRTLRLRHVAPDADIRLGDLLISSGLGGTFPHGYPVGEVRSVLNRKTSPFLDVRIAPTADLQGSRQLLLLFASKREIAPLAGE
ncbi:MAG: rod shape-determining protein MreC [Cellvibrionales bacterium]|nr:rod shape-determining protein MreC [Cellvibrionales bacterium]